MRNENHIVAHLFLVMLLMVSCQRINEPQQIENKSFEKNEEQLINRSQENKKDNKTKEGQTFICRLDSFSSQFDFDLEFKRWPNIEGFDSCKISVTITKKSGDDPLQIIEIFSDYLFKDAYSNCKYSRSYSTSVNDTMIAYDNDYGDFIVADFNFDFRDDLALKRNSGGNGGPSYDYYLQTSSLKFERSTFLSDSIVYFPSTINPEKRELITLVHAGARHLGKHVYKYNPKTKKWNQISHEYLAI
ncbi:MAG: hypothetical protein H6581_16350 [Bacteroidia bacterium]|nr:hypothetical protein [Bacteroidia bacterium]